MKILRKSAIFLLLLLFTVKVFSAGFDCTKAITFVEKTICSESKLSYFDDLLSESYKNSLKNTIDKKALNAEVRDWLINVRNKCQDKICLENIYKDRLLKLGISTEKELSELNDSETQLEINSTKNGELRYSEEELFDLAESGNNNAMYSIGYRYLNGIGELPKDPKLANEWFRKAADSGNRRAIEMIKSMPEIQGENVNFNPENSDSNHTNSSDGSGFFLILLIIFFIFLFKSSAKKCSICNIPIKKNYYNWKIDGKKYTMCPKCNTKQEHRHSRKSFNRKFG
jgi:uncharacterized protein